MRILFFTHYFPPEVNAPASRTFEHCVRWADQGHDVTVVTCQPNCPDGVVFEGYRNRLRRSFEVVEGIKVVRVWTYMAPNAGTLKRIVNFVSFMITAVLATLRLPRPDIVVATSPQFFCGWAGVFASRLKRVPLLLEIRDIWPESIQAVGAFKNRFLLRILEVLERWMYKAADHIVAVGNGYRDNILGKVDVKGRISVITNGVDLANFAPMAPQPVTTNSEATQPFVCSYIGTIGMAHGLEVVIEAAQLLKARGRNDFVFQLVGDGAQRARLETDAQERGVSDMVRFTGRLPKSEMPHILANSHACLVHLKGCELFKTVIPSKIFETMAMQRPIIMGVKGEAARIVTEAQAGVTMEPDNAQSLVEAVTTLADNPELTERLGRQARAFVAEQYNRDKLAEHFLQVMADVAGHELDPHREGIIEKPASSFTSVS